MHKLQSHPNPNPNTNPYPYPNPNQNYKQRQRQRQRENVTFLLFMYLPLIYLFIYYFIWLIAKRGATSCQLPLPPAAAISPLASHVCSLKLNSCIMNKFIVVGFRVSIYLVATLRGLCPAGAPAPGCTSFPTSMPTLTPTFHPTPHARRDCRRLVKNKNNNKSKKCVLISVSCSCQIILPHFLCTKPNRSERESFASFRKSHFTRRCIEYSKILSVSSGQSNARIRMQHGLMDKSHTLS